MHGGMLQGHLNQAKKDKTKTDIPHKSPDAIDIDAILATKSQHEAENAALLAGQSILPQFNGVRVAHPMDPRIDLSKVSVLPAGSSAFPHPMHCAPFPQAAAAAAVAAAASQQQLMDDNDNPPTVESYMTLMEVS